MERAATISPLFIYGEGIEVTMEMSNEPIYAEALTHNYYKGVTGIASYICDIVKRIFQLFLCVFKEPFPEWSWETREIVKDVEITLKDDSGQYLQNNDFFTHLIEYATIPLHASRGETTTASLSAAFVGTDNTKTRDIVVRSHFYNHHLCKVSLLEKTGTRGNDLIVEFVRSDKEIREIQRGKYIQTHIRHENSLWITYNDRAEYKRKVVREGLRQAGITVVSKSSGHPDEIMLSFLEDTIFHAPKNGCTSVYLNPKSRDLEFRCVLERNKIEEIEAAVTAFNEKQTQPPGVRGSPCRLEISRIVTNEKDITEIILAVRQVDLSSVE